MRPISEDIERKTQSRWFIIAVIILIFAISIGLWWVFQPDGQESGNKPYFSKLKLTDKKISADENTLLKVQVKNPGNKNYDDLSIEISTDYSRLRIFYDENHRIPSGNESSSMSLSTKSLRQGMETYLYTFDVGGSLCPGLVSMKVEVDVNLLSGSDSLDEETITLEVKS